MASTIKITNRNLLRLYRGLNGLDGVRKSQTDFQHFVFDTKVRYAIAKNSTIVQRAVDVFEKAQRDATKSCGFIQGEQVTDRNRPVALALDAAINDLKDFEIEIEGMIQIPLTELMKHPIPPSVLSDLIPIIDESA